MKVNYLFQGQSNEVNEVFLRRINEDGRIHLVPSKSKGVYFLRFAVCAAKTESADVKLSWDVISELADTVLKETKDKK